MAATVEKRLLRTSEAATYLGRSKCRLRQLVWDGRLPVVKDSEGGNWYFDRADLDGFIEANKQKMA